MNNTKNIKHAYPYLGIVILLHIVGIVLMWIGGAQYPLLMSMGGDCLYTRIASCV